MARIKKGKTVSEHALLVKGAEVQQASVEADPVKDPGDGRPIILRRFQYQLPPGVRATKQELIAHHKSRIQPFLFKDGLEEVAEPRVVMGKGGKFDIFAVCKVRKGVILNERPKTLEQAINDPTRNRN